MKTTKLIATFGTCLLAVGSSWGAEVWLRAASTTITLPDGTPGGRSVTMWGFAKDSNAATQDGVVTVPGPKIVVPPGDLNLTIHLKNYLPEPVSIVIPGQLGAALGDPTMVTPPDDTRARASSFTHEAPAYDGTAAGTADYTWNNVQPGTFLYHSGSHPAVQVQMGLYGALTKTFSESANNRFAYQGVNYDNEVTLLFSEVDVAVHDAVSGGDFGPGLGMSSTINSRPQYFLINGKAHPAQTPIYLPGGQGQRALLRFLNAGLDGHTPVLNGMYVQAIAEDGKRYLNNKSVYAVDLPALRTKDALVANMPYGSFALYDRRLGLANGASGSGGMLAYVSVPFSQANSSTITIPANGNANPYGSGSAQFTIPGGNGFVIGKVVVSLNNFYHGRPQDVDAMLVHVSGATSQKVMFMSDVGGTSAIASGAPVTLTFDESAPTALTSVPLATGTYTPTNVNDNQGNDTFTGGGIPNGTVSTSLSAFTGVNSAGNWRLYIRDDSGTFSGAVGGWSLTLYPAWQP